MTEDPVEKRVRRKPIIVIIDGQPMWDSRATLKDMTLVAIWLNVDLQFRIISNDEKTTITEG